MLNEHFPGVLLLVLADKARIPEFASDTEILTAADQGVGLAALRGGGDAIGGKVVLFTSSDGDESVMGLY